MTEAGRKLAEHNSKVLKVDTAIDGDDMLMRVTFKAIDQWAIKKQIIYPVAAILTKCGIKVKDVSLDSVVRPPDARTTRPRASDGISTPLDEDAMISHADQGLPD